MSDHNPYISNRYGRFRYFEYPTDYKTVTREHTFEDGSKSKNELSDFAPKRFELVYNFNLRLPGKETNLAVFDRHFEANRFAKPFEFLTKKGILLTNVFYDEYEWSHDGNKSWLQQRRIVLVKYDYVHVESATAPYPPTGLTGAPLKTSPTTAIKITWNPAVAVGLRSIAGYRVKVDGALIPDVIGRTTVDVGSLTPGTPWSFAVASFDSEGEQSPFSPSITVRTRATPPANAAPHASGLVIQNGTNTSNIVGHTLTAVFTYSDAEADVRDDAATVYKWYRADSATGANPEQIAEAFSKLYTLTGADAGKFVRFSVTPAATTGTLTGIETFSDFLQAPVQKFTPAAPTLPVADDAADTISWTDAPGYIGITFYEYSADAGASYASTLTKPIGVGNVNYAAGQLRVRIKESIKEGRNPGEALLFPAMTATATSTKIWEDGIVFRCKSSSLSLANLAAVSTWATTISGLSYAQSVQAKKPLYKTNVIANHPAVSFDNVDDGMDLSAALPAMANATYAIVGVARTNSIYTRVLNAGDGRNFLLTLERTGGGDIFYNQGRGGVGEGALNVLETVVGISNGATGKLSCFRNNTDITYAAVPRAISQSLRPHLGASALATYQEPAGADIFEIIIWNKALTSEQRTAFTNDMSAFYAAQASTDNIAPVIETLNAPVMGAPSRVDLSWTAATDNVGVTGYEITKSLSSTFGSVEIFTIGNVLNFQNFYAAPAMPHFYKIRAFDAGRNYSAYSNVVSITTPSNVQPPPPALAPDDQKNTLAAASDLPVVVSVNDGAYAPYTGTINVGNTALRAGYYKFKIPAAEGRDESPVVNSPEFTFVNPELTNFALASGGAVASSAQTYNESLYPVRAAINGSLAMPTNLDHWAALNVSESTPAYYRVVLPVEATISMFEVTTQDYTAGSGGNYTSVPSVDKPAAGLHITAYSIQYLNRNGVWEETGISVAANAAVRRRHTLITAITAKEFRLKITGGADGHARLMEFGIFGAAGGAQPPGGFSVTENAILPPGVQNTAYSRTIATSGGSGTIQSAAVTAGLLPNGVAVSVSGGAAIISGTPAITGTFTFTTALTDSAGAVAGKDFSLTITATSQPVSPVTGKATALVGGKEMTDEAGRLMIF
jgi:hypothetical protein